MSGLPVRLQFADFLSHLLCQPINLFLGPLLQAGLSQGQFLFEAMQSFLPRLLVNLGDDVLSEVEDAIQVSPRDVQQ